MDNIWLVNAAKKHAKSTLFSRNLGISGGSGQTAGRMVFFLETLGAVFAKEATTAMGDILAFEETAALAMEVLLL